MNGPCECTVLSLGYLNFVKRFRADCCAEEENPPQTTYSFAGRNIVRCQVWCEYTHWVNTVTQRKEWCKKSERQMNVSHIYAVILLPFTI